MIPKMLKVKELLGIFNGIKETRDIIINLDKIEYCYEDRFNDQGVSTAVIVCFSDEDSICLDCTIKDLEELFSSPIFI